MDAAEGATLGDVIEEIVKTRFLKDEFITSISANGGEITEGNMDGEKARPASSIENLEIKTDTFRKASVSALESIGEYLDGLGSMVKVAADKFRSVEEKEANDFFVGCIDGLQTFVSIIDKIKSLNALDFSKIIFNSTPISEKEAALLASLNSILQTQSKKDWVSLADLLEFELAPLILEWKDISAVVAGEMKKN